MTLTQQQIIALAVEAGAIPASDGEYFPHELVICESMFETFAMAAYQRGVRDEREACAKVLDKMADDAVRELEYSGYAEWYREKAAEIRARAMPGTNTHLPEASPATKGRCNDERACEACYSGQGWCHQAAPVALSAEWTPCVKLPVTVHVREQRQGETHVSTREGITPILPSDLIMRGVMGEEYPIGRELFYQTYRLGESSAKQESLTCVAAEREACAITAWNHYMDECRRKNVHPADFGEWSAATAIRARSAE